MSTVVCDASVLVKWVKTDREPETEAAQSILAARARADLRIAVLDLVLYEVGNTLTFKSDMTGNEVSDRLDDLQFLCNDILPLSVALRRATAAFASDQNLSFYDAAHVALARAINAPLITADTELIDKGAGISPTDFVAGL